MGFEYRATGHDEAAIPWSQVCEAIDELAELEVVARRYRAVSFNFAAVARDRTTWTEDGAAEQEADGSIYFLFHVAPPPGFLDRLAQRLSTVSSHILLEEL